MSYNPTNMYDIDPHIAEVYDQSETYRDDVDLLLSLIAPLQTEGGMGFHVLEPFCGTGRILIPLAKAGYALVGLDQAASMLDWARGKLARLSREVQGRLSLYQADVITAEWPSGFDLVILGGNCLYELATPEEQEHVIRCASAALKPGGYVFVDNDHMEGDLAPSWQIPGARCGFPTGICIDGAQVESTTETVWFDVHARLAKFHRVTRINLPIGFSATGKVTEVDYVQQKHPVSFDEVQTWLQRNGFVIEKTFGDRAGNPYTVQSERAIFWARKQESMP